VTGWLLLLATSAMMAPQPNLSSNSSAAPRQSTPESAPLKAYVVADIRVTDAEGYRAYLSAISPVVKKHGGIYIARAGRTIPVEGAPPIGRIVIIEFPSFAAAEAFESSQEALAASEIRHQTATSRIFVVEGSQP
jgi:uncharacterized protein (DUF1330 family)